MIYRKIREINPEIPEKIEKIIEKCLEPEKEKRYQSAEELIKSIGGGNSLVKKYKQIPRDWLYLRSSHN